jgi:hypothetical protein
MILGQLPLRAKLITRSGLPGGSRGTVVIVRTRVGFGVSLVGAWSSCVCRCSNGRSAPKTVTFGDSCGTLSGINFNDNFNQPPEAKPIAQARLSGLLWLPGTTAAGSQMGRAA